MKAKISKKSVEKAVERSSNIEGLSLKRAKKNKKAMALFKKYVKVFSI